MVDLASCYFCGTIDEPLAEHPVVPGSLDPPEDAQRTVVVCSTCRDRLDRVLDTVVAALGEASTERSDDRPASSGVEVRDPGAGGETGINAVVSRAETEPDDGVGIRAADGTADGATSEGGATEEGAAGEVGTGTESLRRAPPEGYGKVLRLLQNREFPAERIDIQEVATSAYDLQPAAAREAIDFLVEEDVLEEHDGVLERPDRDGSGDAAGEDDEDGEVDVVD